MKLKAVSNFHAHTLSLKTALIDSIKHYGVLGGDINGLPNLLWQKLSILKLNAHATRNARIYQTSIEIYKLWFHFFKIQS